LLLAAGCAPAPRRARKWRFCGALDSPRVRPPPSVLRRLGALLPGIRGRWPALPWGSVARTCWRGCSPRPRMWSPHPLFRRPPWPATVGACWPWLHLRCPGAGDPFCPESGGRSASTARADRLPGYLPPASRWPTRPAATRRVPALAALAGGSPSLTAVTPHRALSALSSRVPAARELLGVVGPLGVTLRAAARAAFPALPPRGFCLLPSLPAAACLPGRWSQPQGLAAR